MIENFLVLYVEKNYSSLNWAFNGLVGYIVTKENKIKKQTKQNPGEILEPHQRLRYKWSIYI